MLHWEVSIGLGFCWNRDDENSKNLEHLGICCEHLNSRFDNRKLKTPNLPQ